MMIYDVFWCGYIVYKREQEASLQTLKPAIMAHNIVMKSHRVIFGLTISREMCFVIHLKLDL